MHPFGSANISWCIPPCSIFRSRECINPIFSGIIIIILCIIIFAGILC